MLAIPARLSLSTKLMTESGGSRSAALALYVLDLRVLFAQDKLFAGNRSRLMFSKSVQLLVKLLMIYFIAYKDICMCLKKNVMNGNLSLHHQVQRPSNSE